MLEDLLRAALLMTTPVLLAAIGGLLNRVGGIVNIGLESMMLVGALAALLADAATGAWPLGLAAALAAGGVLGAALGLLVTRLAADEIIVGLGFNVAFAGLVRFTLKAAFGVSGTLRLDGVAMLPRLLGFDPLTWLAWLLVPATAYGLARTRLGLRLRAAGSAPEAARALGLYPMRLRVASTVAAGMLAGLAGAHLSIGIVGLFNEGITGGRGFIALAAFYFGRGRPWPTAASALLFGVFDAAQIRLQGRFLAADLVQTLPYVMVVAALAAVAVLRRRRPALPGA